MKQIIKGIARCAFFADPSSIYYGPMRGVKLPRVFARANLAMGLGVYERHIQRVLEKECQDAKTVYDIGAHVGYFSLLFGHLLKGDGRILAFEPSPRERAVFADLIAVNTFRDRVELLPWAVSDESGELSFAPRSFTGILQKANPEKHKDTDSITVRSVTLDECVYELQKPAPDLLKVDVESAEALVIDGARTLLSEHRPRLLIEVHGPDPCEQTLAKLLEMNYQLFLLRDEERTEILEPNGVHPYFSKENWTNHVLCYPR
ncbi:MAG: FkbM family methyltransferase [Verrucomicrobiota bacterium]